ncbi:MAG: hypothetical protein H7Y11_05295 [Armatimonadetes bacterium]|nr:hypothetical protein [Anaerolineae bacterium]
MKIKLWQALLLGMLIISGMATVAAPGDLDQTFGEGGVFGVVYPLFTAEGAGSADAVASGTDGKLVVISNGFVDSSVDEPQSRLSLARLNSDGTPDTTFGTAGFVTTDFVYASTVAVDNTQRILVAGYPDGNDAAADLIVVRYLPDGTLDNSFAGDGSMMIDLPGELFQPRLNTLRVTANGAIIVAGTTDAYIADGQAFLARINPDGSLDTSFDGDGLLLLDTASIRDVKHVLQDANSKLLVAGIAGDNTDMTLALLRLNADGSLDTAFGTAGVISIDLDSDNALEMVALALVSGDKLLLSASTYSAAFKGLVLARFSADGSPDTSFGTAGIVFQEAIDNTHSLVRLPDDKLVAVGEFFSPAPGFPFQNNASRHVLLTRLNVDGSIDTSFGLNGSITSNFSESGTNFVVGASLNQPDTLAVFGQLLVQVVDENYFYGVPFVARYTLNGAPRVELLQNTSFELPGDPTANWKRSGLAQSKQACDKPDKQKFYAYLGTCALQFKNTVGATAKLKQPVDATAIAVGDVLTLSTWAYSKSASEGVLALKLTYSDGTKHKEKITLTANANGYRWFTSAPFVVPQAVTNASVQLKFSEAGKLYVDDVSLRLDAASTLIPLPDVPQPGLNQNKN